MRLLSLLLISAMATTVALGAEFGPTTFITEDRPVPIQQLVLGAAARQHAVWFVWTDPALKSGVSVDKQPIATDEQWVIASGPVDAVAVAFPFIAWIQNSTVYIGAVDDSGKPIAEPSSLGVYPAATAIGAATSGNMCRVVWSSGAHLFAADFDLNGHLISGPTASEAAAPVHRISVASDGNRFLTAWDANGVVYVDGVAVANGHDPFVASNGAEYLLSWIDVDLYIRRFSKDGAAIGDAVTVASEGGAAAIAWDGAAWDIGYLTPLTYRGLPVSYALSVVRIDGSLLTRQLLTPAAIPNVFNFALTARNGEIVLARQDYWIEAQYAAVDASPGRRRAAR